MPDMQGRSPQANLPEGNSILPVWDCGSESHRGARCGKTARRDLCGGRRVTGVPTATVLRLFMRGKKSPLADVLGVTLTRIRKGVCPCISNTLDSSAGGGSWEG